MVATRQLVGAERGRMGGGWAGAVGRRCNEGLNERPYLVRGEWSECVCVCVCDMHVHVCPPTMCDATKNHICRLGRGGDSICQPRQASSLC